MTIQEANNIINSVTYKNIYFKIRQDIYTDNIILSTAIKVKDACSGYDFNMAPEITIKSTQYFVPQYFNHIEKEEFIYILYNECKRMELHELDEHFKINGKCFKDPHPELKKTS